VILGLCLGIEVTLEDIDAEEDRQVSVQNLANAVQNPVANVSLKRGAQSMV
jgi:hypothetical protein